MKRHSQGRASKRSNGASYKPVYSTLSWGAICGQIDPITKGSDVMQTNVDIFKAELVKQYHNLKDDPEYFAVFSKMTPEDLAEKMIPA